MVGVRPHCLNDSDVVSDTKKGGSLAIAMLAKEWVGVPFLSEFLSENLSSIFWVSLLLMLSLRQCEWKSMEYQCFNGKYSLRINFHYF